MTNSACTEYKVKSHTERSHKIMKIRLDDVMQSMSYPYEASYYYYIPLETVLMFLDGKIYGKAVFGISKESETERRREDFIKLPDLGEEGRLKVMSGFVNSLDESESKEHLRTALSMADAAQYWEDMVAEEKLLMEWYTYRDEIHREFARRWCDSMGLEAVE